MPRLLLYFPADWPLNNSRRAYLEAAGYAPMPYAHSLLGEADLLLLVTPVKDGEGNWLSPEWVWKKYLEREHPNLKPIQAGWHDGVASKNYLNWFDLPPNFEAFVQRAALSKDWEPFDTMGERLEEVWRKFYDGHGKSGFMDGFNAFNRPVSQAVQMPNDKNTEQKIVKHLSKPELVQAASFLERRWVRYMDAFRTGPIHMELDALDTEITTLNREWELCIGAGFKHNRLSSMKQHLDQVEKIILQLKNWYA